MIGGAIGAIDHHLEAVEPKVVRKCGLGELDVTTPCVVDPLGPADFRGVDQRRRLLHQPFDLKLRPVVELVAVGAEQLDAIVGERIVAGGDHHAQVSAKVASQHRDCWSRHRAQQHHVHAHGSEAGHHGRFHHIAGQARVLADHDPVAVNAAQKVSAGRLADAHCHVRGHRRLVGPPANPVSSEEFTSHEDGPLTEKGEDASGSMAQGFVRPAGHQPKCRSCNKSKPVGGPETAAVGNETRL